MISLNFKYYYVEQDSHSFSCVMAKISDENIVSWTVKNINEKDLYTKESDMGIETDPHITILYGLHTNKTTEVKKILQKEKSFKIKFGLISKFKAPKYDVLKIEVKSPYLFHLNRLLKKLDYTSKHEYNPHCTLAYVKKGTCENLVGNNHFKDKQFTIESVIFSSKDKIKTNIELNSNEKK